MACLHGEANNSRGTRFRDPYLSSRRAKVELALATSGIGVVYCLGVADDLDYRWICRRLH